ncbi:HAD domain-containing protein [Streptomyces andamanensis]|uniref:HAD domain-containing protein n=1 Tax=Streptomyces andamanensis TaxID=1565035 RepID=A0ABV8TLS6_9ACTN
MTSAAERPLLFLDVDGPLIPFGSSNAPPPAAALPAEPGGNPLLDRLDPAIGPRLLALGCTLVWATTWMQDANETVAPLLGLPRLPVVQWPATDPDDGPRGLHWKTRPLVEWADGRPFIWLDDEITAMDHTWVTAQHPGRSLLHRVDPARGLADADFRTVGGWLAAMGHPPGGPATR